MTQDLFEHVLAHARQADARRVLRVRVTIGALSDATRESIEFYFNSLAPGTPAEGAALEFAAAPGTARCPSCCAEFEVEELYAACPKCQAFPVQVTGGNGVFLSSMEIETDDEESKYIHE